MNFLIHNATIVTMQNRRTILEGAVATEGDSIVDLGKTNELKIKYGKGYEKINAKGKVIIPGLVNTHQHAAMSLLRGYADDLPLQRWLEDWIWPIEKHMTAHHIYVGATLTAMESIMSGTTTVNTMYHYSPEENEAKAFADVGIRGVIGHVCFSWRKEEDRRILDSLAKDWHDKINGTIRTSVDPHAPYTVDPEYLKELKSIKTALNIKYGSERAPIIWHTHVAETSDEPEKIRKAFNVQARNGVLAYLDSLGVLDGNVVAAHCVALTDKDIAIMKRRNVKVSHNPVSNLKLASGVSPVAEMLRKGITVALGSDSPCSNNTADMFELMKTTAILHKGINRNPMLMPVEQILEMATIGGARALSWEREIGSIEIGKKADIAIVSFNKPHLHPLYEEVSHLVYAAKAADVDTVLVNGKLLLENGELTTMDVERTMEEVEDAKQDLLEKLNANVK